VAGKTFADVTDGAVHRPGEGPLSGIGASSEKYVTVLNEDDEMPDRREVTIHDGEFSKGDKGHSRPDLIISIGD
jgi:hypothetical protein